jgi:hypothetical protein
MMKIHRTRLSSARKSFEVFSIASAAAICTGTRRGSTCATVRAWRRRVNTTLAATPLRRATSLTFAPGALAVSLDRQQKKGLNGSRVLLIGLAYKKNIDDNRENPSLILYELLEERGAKVDFYDPYVPVIPSREHKTVGRTGHCPIIRCHSHRD